MDATTGLTEFDLLLKAINALGVVGVLIFLVVAFYRGDLVSRQVVKEIVKAVVDEVLVELRHEQAMQNQQQQQPTKRASKEWL